MIARLSKFILGLVVMGMVAGGMYVSFVYGGGKIAPGERPTPTQRFTPDDRGSDRGNMYATPPPSDDPLNAATAEAWSLSVYKTAVAGAEMTEPTPASHWADALPDCATGKTPCVFRYDAGPPAQPRAANLSTGGTNTGSAGHPQKDTDLVTDPWAGDKP